jgi:hypothetical protein
MKFKLSTVPPQKKSSVRFCKEFGLGISKMLRFEEERCEYFVGFFTNIPIYIAPRIGTPFVFVIVAF